MHIWISISIKFHFKVTILVFFGPNLPQKGISKCNGTYRWIKKELTSYGTARPRGKFANENAMALLGEVRESWPSITPLGHVELAKRPWHF